MYFTSWQQVLSPWTKHQFWVYQQLDPSILTLIQFRVSYSSSWSLFQLYGESVNVSYIVDLCRWSLLCQNLPKSLLCHAYYSSIKPLLAILQLPWPFVSTILQFPWSFVSTIPCYQFITSCLWWSLSWNSVPIPYPISLWLTSCWMMKDSLMPSFQWISSYWLQLILL